MIIVIMCFNSVLVHNSFSMDPPDQQPFQPCFKLFVFNPCEPYYWGYKKVIILLIIINICTNHYDAELVSYPEHTGIQMIHSIQMILLVGQCAILDISIRSRDIRAQRGKGSKTGPKISVFLPPIF